MPPSPYDEGMEGVPEHVRDLVRQREAARAERDFALADALRNRIAEAGFLLRDTPAGAVLEVKPPYVVVDPRSISSILSEPATLDFTVQLLHEGYPGDLQRFLGGLRRGCDLSSAEVVVVDPATGDGREIDSLCAGDAWARVLHLDRDPGWAAARNVGLSTSRGRVVVLADLSIEPLGEILAPLAEALSDPSVGVAGPFGLVSEHMRDWESSSGPEVDAIEGYLLATRRELLTAGLVREKFTWYRHADLDLSFQLRAEGRSGIVVPLPVERHAHRGWEALSEEERARRSKRNHYLFFDRWKHSPEMLSSNRGSL